MSFEDYSYSRFNQFEIAESAFGVNFATIVGVRLLSGSYSNFRAPLMLYGKEAVLSDNATIKGDIIFAGGSLNLAGKTLTIVDKLTLQGGTIDLDEGTLIGETDILHTGGTMYVHGGTLDVAGDYDITSSDKSSYSTGYLKMTNTADRVIVDGNFVMDSWNDHSAYLTAGVLEIKGDFTQKRTYTTSTGSRYNFYASGTHRVLLSGSSLQTVKFEDIVCLDLMN